MSRISIRSEIEAYQSINTLDNPDNAYKRLINSLGEVTVKKMRAILDILEEDQASIAHSRLVLHLCEDALDRCSLTFGTRRDET